MKLRWAKHRKETKPGKPTRSVVVAKVGLTDAGRKKLSDMMKKHLSTTSAEVMARLHKDWAADVRAFDDVYNHILMMADALSDGIIKQFPDKFSH